MSGEEIYQLLKQDVESLKKEVTYLKCKVEEQSKINKQLENKLRNRTKRLLC